MKRAIQERWIEALRSREYPQTTGTFHRTRTDGQEAYCVMGVLTDLAIKDGVLPEGTLGTSMWPQKEIVEWSGLDADLIGMFIELNDGYDISFEDFADLMDGQWEEEALSTAVTNLYTEKADEHYNEYDEYDDLWDYDYEDDSE